MNLHEHQAKELLKQAGIDLLFPRGEVIFEADQIESALRRIESDRAAVKAQIHAGGRGKSGGVRLVNKEEASAAIKAMLGSTLVTKQTGAKGRIVRRVLVEEVLPLEREYYLALLIDREAKKIALLAAPGGMEIEERDPALIQKFLIDPLEGILPSRLEKFARSEAVDLPELSCFLPALYNFFCENDCSLLEINPLARLADGRLAVLDAKVTLDENALPRHPELSALRDPNEEDESERLAREAGLAFVKLEGSIGCMVNGAGLAMATMDLIAVSGLKPANFLDVGGRSNADSVAQAMRIVLRDPGVRVVLVNIFGGIVRCDEVARGIAAAGSQTERHVPVVVRLTGTNEDEGRRILTEAGYNTLTSMDAAARRAVELAQENTAGRGV